MESTTHFRLGTRTFLAIFITYLAGQITSTAANPLNVCVLLRKDYPCNITVSAGHGITMTNGYRLEFGDGSTAVTFSDISTVTPHSYSTVGVYTVTLTINPGGSNNLFTKTITVKEVIKNATVHMPSFLCVVGEHINFTFTISPDIPVETYSKLGSANWTEGSLISCREVGAQPLAIFVENGISAVVMKCLLNVTVISMNFTWSPPYYAPGVQVPIQLTKPAGNYGIVMVFPGNTVVNCSGNTVYFNFSTPNYITGHKVSMIATDNVGNAAKITKNILIFPALNGTLKVIYPTFAAMGVQLEYRVDITADNLSHSFNFSDGSPVVKTAVPMTTYVFHTIGIHCVTVTSSNPVSSLSTVVCTKIVEPIQGLSCAEEIIKTPLGSPSPIGFVVENGTEFTMKLQIMSSLPTYEISNATAHDIFVIYKEHNYTQVGEYTSTVTASNIVGNATAKCLILVQRPITNLHFHLIYDTEYLEMNATLKITVTVNGTDPLLEYNYGDGTPAFNSTGLTMYHRYQKFGYFMINITARNNVSEMTINKTIFVSKPVVLLQRMLLLTKPVNLTDPTFLKMRIGQGSDFNCTVNYGNNISKNYCYNLVYFENSVSLDKTPFMNLDLNESYVYPAEGYYYITVTCSNRRSNVTNTTHAQVLKPITDFVLTPQPPQIFGSQISIPFNMTAGTNVTVYFYIDDKQMESTVFVTDTGGSVLMKPYQHYSQATDYRIKCYAKNLVSEYNATEYTMTLQIPITQLTCNITTTTPYPDVGIPRCLNESNIFPAEHPIIFPANPDNGTNLTCLYQFGDGATINTSNLTVNHQYALEHRKYQPSVTCSNLVSSVTCCFPISMEMKVKTLTVTNNGPKKVNHTITFTLNTEEYGTGTCFAWDFSDNTPIHVIGQAHCSKLTFPQGQKYFPVAEGASLINAYHAYSTVNQFFVRIQATNNVSCTETENQAVSVLKECFYPNVSMRIAGENVTMAAQIRRSEVFQVSNEVEVYCEISSVTNYSWIVTRVQDMYNNTIPREVMSLPTVKMNAPIPTFFARTLPYGTYEFNVTVYMEGTIGVRTIEIGYFAIVCTPYIIAKIKGGCLLKRKFGSVILMDGSDTRDLDHEPLDYSNMTFYWFCRKESETLNIADPESVPVIQIPSSPATSSGSGGCFGTGAGRLDSDSTNITLDTKLLQADQNFVVTLVVVKNDSCGIRIGKFDQVIQLTTDDIPLLSTKCSQNCDLKVNTNQKLSYQTSCEYCDIETVFKWKIFELSSCDGNPIDPANMVEIPNSVVTKMMAGDSSSLHMVIQEHQLTGDKCYTFNVTATRGKDQKIGENAFTIQTNGVPHSGSMNINPTTGTALNTTYSIYLDNWMDSDIPLSYECGIKEGEDFRILAKTQEPPIELKLPAGDAQNDHKMTIECRVIDRAGASTVVTNSIQVKPMNISGDKLLDFLNHTINNDEGLVSKAIQEADFSAIFQLTHSISDMMADMYKSAEEEKKQNITEEQNQVLGEEESRRSALKLSLIKTLSTVDMGTLTDSKLMAGAVDELTKGYKDLDSISQELGLVILEKVKSQLLNAPVAQTAFSDVIETARSLLSALTQVGMSSAISAKFNTTDSQFNVTGITSNDSMTGMVSNTERAKERVLLITDSFNQIGSRIQDALLPGEPVLVLKTDNINCSVSKAWYTELGDMKFGDGLSEILFPPLEAMGLSITDPTKDYINLMSTSMLSTLYSWSNTSSLIKSQDVSINMAFPLHTPLDTSHFSEPATIYIPRDAEEIPPLDTNFMRIYREDEEAIDYLQIHSFDFTSPDEATHVQIFPKNGSHQYQAFLQYNERAYPEPGKYLFNWTLPDFSSCNVRYINQSKSVTVDNTTHQVVEVVPKRDCLTDPHTLFIPYSLVNRTGTYYMSILYSQPGDPNPSASPSSREKRAVPGTPCGGHRMKRSCVIIPPPPPKPTTDPPYGASRLVGTRPPNVDFLGRPIDFNNTVWYDVRIYKTNCMFFNKTTNTWGNNGCVVGNETRKDRVQCKCNHFTSFGSDFFVAPNPIDFDKVFSADLSKNPVVLSVVCSIFGLYLILAIFARRADKADEKKTGVTPLPANAAPGSHSYLVAIHTGVRMNAGTTANVCIVLSGENGEAPPTLLTDPERPLFTRGADNSLVMTIPFDIGRLTHVRVWHDNTGDNPSWYLSRIAIEDLHNHKKYYFVCERWLAVEEDDGRVDRILPVASKKELTQFSHLFVGKTVRELGDGHLWFSIITRPPNSVFTRLQRLSCGISLLYCTMITSCMFYNTGGGQENPTYILYIGSLKIDLRQMVIGLQSSLIVFPVNLLLVQIFRKIRPNEPGDKEDIDDVSEAFENISTCSEEDERAEKMEEKKKKKKEKKKGLHPRWRYVAWATFFLSTSVSATFTVFYSLSWGPEIANKWLVAFVLSFFQSVLLIQPIKVLFASIVFALIIRKPIATEDENPDDLTDTIESNNKKSLFADDIGCYDKQGVAGGPPSEFMLMQARQKRLKEIQMSTILREIFAYFIFLAVLLLVAYGNRDPNAYLLRKSLMEQFVEFTDENMFGLGSAGDADSFWHWARETLVPGLYPGALYNNKSDKYTGFISDRNNYLVGISRLRQERVKKDSCNIAPVFKHVFSTCLAGYSITTGETGDYDIGWKYLNKSKTSPARKRRSVEEQFWFTKGKPNNLVEYADSSKVKQRTRRAVEPIYVSTSGRQQRRRVKGGDSTKVYFVLDSAILPDGSIMSCPSRWIYHNPIELRGFPYWGKLNFYGGGGYPADLGYDYSTALTVVADVNSHDWVGAQTRAIFVEFTVYNANTNLFGVAFLFMEFLPNGGAFPNAQFAIARLYSYVGPFAKLILAMEVLMLLFMFYFMYREIKLMFKQKKLYFHGFWNWLEVALIVLEFVMVIMFFARMWETDKNFIKFHDNPKAFTSFQYASASDQTLTYVIGILVFLVTLRFLKLLRFNKKMAFIGNTIGFIAKPIGLFMISFSIIFFAYGSFAHLIFGPFNNNFKTLLSTAVTQMRILLGDFDYYDIEASDRLLGPLYFFTFMYVIVFFLMNMFLAIINDSFAEVKELENELSNEYEMVEFILSRFRAQFNFMRGSPKQIKTPIGFSPDIPFWEYKHRSDSIWSDSEFSTGTNYTSLKTKRNVSAMGKDLDDVLERLGDMHKEDVESDELLMMSLQFASGPVSETTSIASDID